MIDSMKFVRILLKLQRMDLFIILHVFCVSYTLKLINITIYMTHFDLVLSEHANRPI